MSFDDELYTKMLDSEGDLLLLGLQKYNANRTDQPVVDETAGAIQPSGQSNISGFDLAGSGGIVAKKPKELQESGDVRTRIAAAAAETDRQPSEAQKEVGNYNKGRFSLHGLSIAIENPRGSFRRGTDSKGKGWSVRMPAHYGYVLGGPKSGKQKGNDSDAIDVLVGPYPESELVFVVDQSKPDGSFDEHKCVLAVRNEAEAKQLYMDSYSPGWKGFMAITPFTLRQFKLWLEHGNMARAVAMQETLPPAADLDSAARLLWESGENYP